MGTVRHEIRIDASTDEVWAVVGRADLLHLWFPGIEDCSVETVDGVTSRTITMATGIQMPERITACDALIRRFQYRITAPLFTFHQGTIDVIDVADERGPASLVVYSTDAEPSVMALVIGGGTLGALRELQRQFAAGDGPALQAARSTPLTALASDAHPNQPAHTGGPTP